MNINNEHLILVLSARCIQGLDQVGGVAQEHGVAGGSHDHAHDGQPHIAHTLGRMGTVSYAQHVAHSHEQCIGILDVPCGILG